MNAARHTTPAKDMLVNITTVCETLCLPRTSIYRDINYRIMSPLSNIRNDGSLRSMKALG